MVVPLLFTLAFFLFKKVLKDKLILFFTIGIFYSYILLTNSFQTFGRYGILVFVALFFSFILYSQKILSRNLLLFLGLLMGIVLSLINDIGTYLVVSFLLQFLIKKLIHSKKINKEVMVESVKELMFVFFGFILGVLPIILIYNGNVANLLNYFKDVNEVTSVAKTPFFSFVDSPANIFSFTILFTSLFWNLTKFVFLKQKTTLITFMQISLMIEVILMEQKSIIRSIDLQIIFLSIVLLMFMVYEILGFVKNKNKKNLIYTSVLTSAVIISVFILKVQTINAAYAYRNISLVINSNCYENNLKIFTENNPEYVKIVNFLSQQHDFNNKIYSFPTGDSALYVLLHQKPPFYNAIFEGASKLKQESSIKYIRDNKIEFITLNTEGSSIQDGVPDFIRQSYLFGYILDNYYPVANIGKHLVLERENGKDFFNSNVLNKISDYKKYLLNVFLYRIPYSEGLYKFNYLSDKNISLLKTDNMNIINSFLNKENFYSSEKVVVLTPKIKYKKSGLNFITLKTKDGLSTTIYYNSCSKNSPCIINLARIPLFYKDRIITKVSVDSGFNGYLEFFSLKNPNSLW